MMEEFINAIVAARIKLVMETREEIVTAFIAKYGFEPDMAEQQFDPQGNFRIVLTDKFVNKEVSRLRSIVKQQGEALEMMINHSKHRHIERLKARHYTDEHAEIIADQSPFVTTARKALALTSKGDEQKEEPTL